MLFSALVTAATQHARYEALLAVIASVAQHRDLPGLFRSLDAALRPLIDFDYLGLILHNPERKTFRLHIVSSTGGPADPPEFAAEQSPAGWVYEKQQPIGISDTETEARWPLVLPLLRQLGVRTTWYLPLTSARDKIGVICFGNFEKREYSPEEIEFMGLVAQQVAVAVDNVQQAQQLASERDRLRVLLEITNSLVTTLEMRPLFTRIGRALQRVIPHDYAGLALVRPNGRELRLWALDFPGSQGFMKEEAIIPIEQSAGALAIREKRPHCLTATEVDRLGGIAGEVFRREGIHSLCAVPLLYRDKVLGTINLGRVSSEPFLPEQLDLLVQVAAQVAIAVENTKAYREIERLNNKLNQERLYLEDEIRSKHDFTEMIGQSEAFQRVLRQIETVAPTDATVLILGETGTGKELVARAIHNLSRRNKRSLIKLNCAAIPTGLLESELFGHERGAFTGAIAQRIGRLELAHQGTLFLDEIGDIPLELQPKLLRALQEHEFERLGSSRTQKVDTRLIAATNRDLAQMVEHREFRSDLYYRLNVFPIHVPSLRERREDIPLLVRYFAQKFAQQLGRNIERIPHETMEALERYPWPGNIRELENVIERAVIVSSGDVLQVPRPESAPIHQAPADEPAITTPSLEEADRAHILRVLEAANWKVAGKGGAAERLGLKRTTLLSKMAKLGIQRPHGATG